MTWTRLSDDFADRPDILALSNAAFRAHVCAYVWCNKHTTDGRLPVLAVRRAVGPEDNPDEVVAELLEKGVWSRDGEDYVLDWSDQESAERVQRRKEYNAAKQDRYRDRKSRHEAGDHSECDPRFCKLAVTSNATGNEYRRQTGTRPDPSRPDPSRPEGTGDGEQGARATNPADADSPTHTEEQNLLARLIEIAGTPEKAETYAEAERPHCRTERGALSAAIETARSDALYAAPPT